MQEEQIVQSSEYARTVAELVATMPTERAAQVYDFVRFLLSQPTQPLTPSDVNQQRGLLDDEEWLSDSEEQMQAEDALWDVTHARHADKFDTLAEAARLDIQAGTAQPMFDEQGEFVTNELPHHT